MKRFTIFLVAMCATLTGFAQFEQGRMLVGGSLGFTSTTNLNKSGSTAVTNYKQTEFSVAPNFGIFIIDNLAAGATLELNFGTYKPDNGSPKTNYSSIQFIPMARYYLPQKVFFHGQFGLGSGVSKTNGALSTFEDKSNLTSWALAAGYAIFLNDNVAIEPMLGYESTSIKDKETKRKDIDRGLFLRVGFQIYLN